MALLCGPIVPLSTGEVTPRADLSAAEGEFVRPSRNPEPRHVAPRALKTDDEVSGGRAWLSVAKAKFAVVVLVGITVMSLFGCMFQPPHGAGGGNSIRLPPRWEPAMETTLPFRTWMQDLMLWTIGTDLAPHQQAVATISQLGGPARDLARTLTPGELYNGGVINGQALDPVSFLLHGLSSRFAPLDEENRLRAAQDLLSFARRQGESIDALISRFDITRELARREGGGAVAIETATLILLRACGVSSEQFQSLTQPFGLRLPANDAEFSQLCHHLRRMAHIVERHPNNIASGLRQTSQAHFSQASYLAEADTGSSHSAEHWQQGSGGLEYSGADASRNMDWAFAAALCSDRDEPLPVEDLQGMTNGQVDEYLFGQYQQAKRRWRRFTGKP
ncbi:NPF8.5, partial [Symbiodinium sp. CCMP2592]